MIVVAGGTSPLGRLVVRHLLNRLSPNEIAVTAPHPEEATDLVALGIDVRREDFEDPLAAAQAFTGADQVLIISLPGRLGVGVPVSQAIPCADAAIAAHPEHIVYTSIINAPMTHHLLIFSTEGHLQNSGVPFTILRNNLQSEALLPALQLALASNEFVCAFDDRTMAPAARTDYAEAAAIVLTEDRHRNQILQLSGPIGLKAHGVASVISQIADKEIPVREVEATQLISELVSSGATPEVAAELDDIYNDTRLGEWSIATQTLEEVLGHHRLPLVDALRSALREAGGR